LPADETTTPVRGVTVLIIFDCDGVLVDSEVLAHELLAAMMTELGHGMTTGEAISKFAGRRLTDVLDLAEATLGRAVPGEVGRRYAALLADRLRRDLRPIDGVEAAIAALPYRRCVASSSSVERVRLSLEATGLLPLFEGRIFSAAQVARGKPAPDLYLLAARTMGVAPRRCVVIEDSPLGVTAGVAAGMTVIGFAGGGHADADLVRKLSAAGARRVLSSMRDLASTVAKLAA
jgi:HAD superfamily hydrolase (TIGR01509 family)